MRCLKNNWSFVDEVLVDFKEEFDTIKQKYFTSFYR